jgi:hypothetical protein
MNIFEAASRNKVRFASDRGELTTEQLWDLNLTSLDKVARDVNKELKSVTEDSFIATKVDARKAPLELKLEIVKFVIDEKLAEAEARKTAAEKALKKKVLEEALANRQNEKINSMSEEDLKKALADL